MSDAISAQGTRFEIQDAVAGAAVNITAISKANPGVFTAAAHGLAIGAVVDLAAIGGMVQLNGRTAILAKAQFAVGAFTLLDGITGDPIDTTNYTVYTNGGTATPKTFLETKEHQSYAFAPSARATIDTTTLVSGSKESVAGLNDFGTFSAGMNIVKAEPAQKRMKAARKLQKLWYRITDPLGNVTVFQGIVKSFGEGGGVDAIAKGSLELQVTGEQIEVN